ncbi:hypothetical protein ACROYT_G017214 [Oculina patagonica]
MYIVVLTCCRSLESKISSDFSAWSLKYRFCVSRRDLHQSQRDLTLQQQLNIKCTGLEDNFGDRIFFSRGSFIIKNKPTR